MTEIKQQSLVDAFLSSVNACTWLSESDTAIVQFGVDLAYQLDAMKLTGEVDKFTVLAPKYLAVLQQLHLTPETRTQGKQHDETTGSDYAQAFIRLVETKTAKPASGGNKRRPSSSATSGRPRSATSAMAKNST